MHRLHHMRKCGELTLLLWALGTQGLKNFELCVSLSLAGRQLAYLPMTGRGGLRSLETFEPTIVTKAWQFIHVATETDPARSLLFGVVVSRQTLMVGAPMSTSHSQIRACPSL